MKRTPLARKAPMKRTAMKRSGGGLHPKMKAPTKFEKSRMDAMKGYGCICCAERGLGYRETDIHHMLIGGYRAGHRYTIPLCLWHHMGEAPEGWTNEHAEAIFGPSLANRKRAFVEVFGTEHEILHRVDAVLSTTEVHCARSGL